MTGQHPQAAAGRPARVVIVGGGFGGLRVARGLRGVAAQVVVVDRRNHHLFQPLLYQVATGLLPGGDIAPALRDVLADQRNARIVLGEVTAVDADGRAVEVTTADGTNRRIGYDHLVLAAGTTPSYFGHDDWRGTAPPMKTLQDALSLRDRLLRAFEAAAVTHGDERRAWMTFVVVGAGPTGVELAGQLSALARRTLRREFHELDTDDVRIVLADGGDAVLSPFAQPLREHTARAMAELGVEVQLGRRASGVDETGVTFGAGADSDGPARIEARTVVWAAGVRPVPLAVQVARDTGTSSDRGGRLKVESDCTLPGHPEIFAIGDMVDLDDLPGIAEPAIQEGKYVARVIRHRLGEGSDPGRFRYRDLGTMATISPLDAVADIRGMHLTGVLGKLAWAGVHIAFLVGWPNRAATLAHWAWVLTTGGRQHQVILRGRAGRARRGGTPAT
ncbi:FAD-dependent oxidoreductase [Cellulomonas septica]|uniref:NADH:ubiquinone reductase (non-electrogenic) n=1 Tax=Cellulomonas septica TaxID=285080 RepID=A0ABX1JZ76_9CELL|nr:NAD(P)/FAD-dependent oxidoreductase [Cellulomonas septica]